jgi:hypothetical protein
VQITKEVGFHFLNPTKLVWDFLIFLRISRSFTRQWTKLQEKLDRVLHKPALKFYPKHPNKIQIAAIESLAGEGGAGPAKSGEPAAIPAGQAAVGDH